MNTGRISKGKYDDAVGKFIVEFWHKNKYSPSYREICEAVGISSTSVATYVVSKITLAEVEKYAQHRVQLTALRIGGLWLIAGVIIGWLGCLAFIGGN